MPRLAQRVGQMLLRADDMADAHQRVVHGRTEVIHWQAIAPHDHEVAHGAGVEAHVAAHGVLHQHLLVDRGAEAVAVRHALPPTCSLRRMSRTQALSRLNNDLDSYICT